jgi:hypothetical protein
VRKTLAGWLIRLAHRIYRPQVTVTIFPGAVRCTGDTIEHAAAGAAGYRALMALQRQATRWN